MTSKMPSRADELNNIEGFEMVYRMGKGTKGRRERDEVNSVDEGTLALMSTKQHPMAQPQLCKRNRTK
jgi:hypothetical protein